MKVFRKSEYEIKDSDFPQIIIDKGIIPGGKIMQISFADFKSQQSCPKHQHIDLFEVFVVDDGEIDLTTDEETVHITEGDCVLIYPLHDHSLVNKSNTTCKMLVIGISCPDFQKVI